MHFLIIAAFQHSMNTYVFLFHLRTQNAIIQSDVVILSVNLTFNSVLTLYKVIFKLLTLITLIC